MEYAVWHCQRWCACLAKKHGLKTRFVPLLEQCEAGWNGGSAQPLAIADMPMGVAGVSGMGRSVSLEDPSAYHHPPRGTA
eukprot:3763452-Karenia_brevis.AAC.1